MFVNCGLRVKGTPRERGIFEYSVGMFRNYKFEGCSRRIYFDEALNAGTSASREFSMRGETGYRERGAQRAFRTRIHGNTLHGIIFINNNGESKGQFHRGRPTMKITRSFASISVAWIIADTEESSCRSRNELRNITVTPMVE